jgi:hypothetical protein
MAFLFRKHTFASFFYFFPLINITGGIGMTLLDVEAAANCVRDKAISDRFAQLCPSVQPN